MAARIVYEGAAGAGGDLFEGKKLWISHRVPMLSYWKDQIKANGGLVVQLDLNADITIVDHARKDCPVGSISWTWIEKSIRNGRLEDIEDHRAGPTKAQVREVGSTQPTKKTRTKFSVEDDRALMAWVMRAERKGFSILGNTIYQQLAEKYSHHTWQSWRDRWRKHVSFQTRLTLPEDDEEEEDEDPEPEPVAPKPRKKPRKRPSSPRPIPRSARASVSPLPIPRPKTKSKQAPAASPIPSEKSQNSTRSLKSNPFLLKSTGGNVFIREESQLLFDAYDQIMDLDDDQVIDAWIAWSAENPNHTPQEWHNHFKEYIVPTKRARIESKKSAKQSKEMPPPKSTTAPKQVFQTTRALEIRDSQGSSGRTCQAPANEVEIVTSYTNCPREFAKNLLILADSLGLEVDPNPVICGQKISLYSLWQVVQSAGGYDEITGQRTWSKVAQKLEFDGSQQKDAGRELRNCFGEILCDLESAEKELREDGDMTSDQEAELIADQLRQTAEQPESLGGEEEIYSEGQQEQEILVKEEEHDELLREQEENDDELNYVEISPHRPQPPSPSTGKRRSGSVRRSSDLPYNKRQRVDKGKCREQLEIPSTPEDVINNTQMSRPSHQPSPLKYGHAEPPSPSADSLVQDVRPLKLKRKKPAVAQHLEPETQDFYHSSPVYPSLPSDNMDDDEVEIAFSAREPPEDLIDEDDEEEERLRLKQRPPRTQDQPSQRNSSNATTRVTLHSSNNVSNAAMRGTAHSSSTNYESSTQSQTESQNDERLQAFFRKHEADGFAQEIIAEALQSTSMQAKGAVEVMDILASGDGIPDDIPGVWTSWDDDALESGRGTDEYKRIVTKHGISRIAVRKRYLKRVQAAEAAEAAEATMEVDEEE